MDGDVFLSFDLDWAPAWATAEIGARLHAKGVVGTFFVTHPCPSLEGLRDAGHELGWHPNFLPGSSHGSTFAEVLDTLAGWVPDAVGARAHCLMRGTPLLQAYAARGLRYDASDIHDGLAGLEVFESWTGIQRLPIWFEDDVRIARGLPCTLESLDLDAPGLKIVNLHPVLVALNGGSEGPYASLKASLAEGSVPLPEATSDHFAPHRNDRGAGVSDLLDELVEWLAAHPERQGGRLRDLVDATQEDS